MDTIARHPLTSLCVVAVFVALALHFGIPDPPPRRPAPGPEPPPPPTLDESREYSGRVASVEFNPPPTGTVLVLLTGRDDVVCSFPPAGDGEGSPVAQVRDGDAVAVRGNVEGREAGRVYLSGCELVPPPKP